MIYLFFYSSKKVLALARKCVVKPNLFRFNFEIRDQTNLKMIEEFRTILQ